MNEIAAITQLKKEEQNSTSTLHLTANENILSTAAGQFLSGPLSNRYHIGTTHSIKTKEYFSYDMVQQGGLCFKALPHLYAVEELAEQALLEMTKGKICDLRSLSGVHATMSTLLSFSKVGDLIYSLSPSIGGHFATQNIIESIGRKSSFLPFSLTNGCIHLDRCKKIPSPAIIFLDDGAPVKALPVSDLREIFPTSLIIYDASHTLGLICGKQFQNPLYEGADILQGNTHKTFFGPQKGIVIFKDEEKGHHFQAMMGQTFVSSQHTGNLIALLISILEMKEFGIEYALQIIENQKTLSNALAQLGFTIFCESQSHIILMQHENPKGFCEKLQRVGISVNAKNLFNGSLIRLGVQEVTRRGMKKEAMEQIAYLFHQVENAHHTKPSIIQAVQQFISRYMEIHYSYDQMPVFS